MKKILLIFGAGGALGKGCTKVLIQKDYDKIYLFDSKNLEVTDNKVEHVKTEDLSKEKNVISALEKVKIEKDAHYFLFSTIGGFAGGKQIAETSLDEFNKMITLNINISFLIAKHFVKLVGKTSGGSICFTSAMTSLGPAENKVSYGLSKNGLNYLIKTLAKEGRKNNLSANAIAPLVLDTPGNREWVKDSSIIVNPDAIGKLVQAVFENSRVISGNIIEVPGTLN